MARAPKVTVKIPDSLKNKLLGLNKHVATPAFANQLGPIIIQQMKNLIAKGSSPVKGVGRFVAYKGVASIKEGKSQYSVYPYSAMKEYPDKKVRPVNLSLTGAMLSFLSFRLDGSILEVGILPDAPNKQKVIARVHNTGERPDIPQRQFIPDDGEEFTVTIMAVIKKLYRKRIIDLLNE
jgi:hypothetical protein